MEYGVYTDESSSTSNRVMVQGIKGKRQDYFSLVAARSLKLESSVLKSQFCAACPSFFLLLPLVANGGQKTSITTVDLLIIRAVGVNCCPATRSSDEPVMAWRTRMWRRGFCARTLTQTSNMRKRFMLYRRCFLGPCFVFSGETALYRGINVLVW